VNEEPREISASLTYDMRAPDFGAAAVDLYRAAVEQCAWADRLGFDSVSLLEHHASVDGYLPSPIVLGSAVAGVTERMLIRMSVVLLPLYDPIRAAEDLAVLDLISDGRLRLTVGAGYRDVEYEQFGLDIKRRPSLMEHGISVLKQAWSGEPFEYRGHTVRVLPRPAQRPRPEIALGGSSPAAAKRAARIADDFQPVVPKLYDIYLEELAALGKPVPERRVRSRGGGMFFHIAEDPDRAWASIAPHAMHETNDYAEWAKGMRGSPYRAFDSADELRASGMYEIVTPEAAVDLIRDRGGVSFKPLMGGLDPEVGWESLHLFEHAVLPKLRDADGSTGSAST
jgi:alkanesulfonate monooxygenase SsuD/methylene tetrahydromethanopterin reductase-like flavin-dependent oxidoreductase (luciferase family)